jgi:hypothetical protein
MATWQLSVAPAGAELEPAVLPSGAAAFPALARTGAPPPVDWPPAPKLEPRSAYGGWQSICEGPGLGEPHTGTLPSRLAGPAQMVVTGWACATHVHVDGQAALLAHGIVFAWQDDVELVVVVQEGGGEDASTAPITTVPASTRMAGPEPVVGVAGAPPETPDPVEPPPEHEVMVSGKQVKPSPQSLSTLHGRS